jgi:16S rRNA (adenine(1408)-N(1))-methyltransferase
LLAAARRDPDTLYAGLDTNIAALKAASRSAARRPARGGVPNVAFIAGSALELPGPLACFADAITVLLPWGSLLQAVLSVDGLRAIRGTARPGATFAAVASYDPSRDGAEWQRLGLSPEMLECGEVERTLALTGWCKPRVREMGREELAAVGSTWAKRIARSPGRRSWQVAAVAD